MKIASITQTKNNLSAYIDMVRHGETILIMDRNKPVARLEPTFHDESADPDGRLARLERAGLIRKPVKHLSSTALLHSPPPRPKTKVSVVEALLEERAEGR